MNCSNPSSNFDLARPASPATSHLKTERGVFTQHDGMAETLEVNRCNPSSDSDWERPGTSPQATREPRGHMPIMASQTMHKRESPVMPSVEQLLQRHCPSGAAKTEVPAAPAKQVRTKCSAQVAHDARACQPPKATTVGALQHLQQDQQGESSDSDNRVVLSDTDDDTDEEKEITQSEEVTHSASHPPLQVKPTASYQPSHLQFRPMTEGDLPPLRSASACSSRPAPGSRRAFGMAFGSMLTTPVKASTHVSSSKSSATTRKATSCTPKELKDLGMGILGTSSATPRKATSCTPKELKDLGMGILGTSVSKDPKMLPNVVTPRVRHTSSVVGA